MANVLQPCAESYLSSLYPQGIPASLKVIRIKQGEVPAALSEAKPPAGPIHAVFEMDGRIRRFWRLRNISRQLARRCFVCQFVGLHGAVGQPDMLVPLHHNILNYVQTITFRGVDSPAWILFKRLVGYLPCMWTWSGPLILVAAPVRETFDRFVLLRGDREIAFLFRDNEKAPWAVRKTGNRNELIAEHENHSWAGKVLGRRVPALLGIAQHEQLASITFEYVPERFLANVVASEPFRRRKVFVREALAHLSFCREICGLFAAIHGVEYSTVAKNEVDGLLKGIDALLANSNDADIVKRALAQTIGLRLPRIMQHGDFSVCNVLIAGGNRNRILIDWEDMQERRWPLVDFVMLRLSLKETYSIVFNSSQEEMERLSDMARGLAEAEAYFAKMLDMDQQQMEAAQLLSLACLARQNHRKNRKDTANCIFQELILRLQS